MDDEPEDLVVLKVMNLKIPSDKNVCNNRKAEDKNGRHEKGENKQH